MSVTTTPRTTTTPKAGDLTGRIKAEADRKLVEEARQAEQDGFDADRAAADELQSQTVDLTGKNASVPVVIDSVEVLSEQDSGPYETIRVAEDVEDATIASHEGVKTYTFRAGGKYKVPANVAFVLRERGLVYDRV